MIRDLYVIDARKLAEDLRDGKVSEDLAFKHLLGYSILFASQLSIPVALATDEGGDIAFWLQAIIFLCYAGIQYWGMNLLYRTNKAGDGAQFFTRWAALSLPVGVQIALIAIALSLVFGAAITLASSMDPGPAWVVAGNLLGFAIQVIYFRLMQQNLAIAADGTAQATGS